VIAISKPALNLPKVLKKIFVTKLYLEIIGTHSVLDSTSAISVKFLSIFK